MRIVIAAATSICGTALAEALAKSGENVCLLVPSSVSVHPIGYAILPFSEASGLEQAVLQMRGPMAVEGWINLPALGFEAADSRAGESWVAPVARAIEFVYHGCRAASVLGAPSVVTILDAAGTMALAEHARTATISGALAALTRALAVDSATLGIRVNAVAVPTLPVEIAAGAKRGILGAPSASELADAIRFLLSPEASYVTGEVLRVDGGWLAYHYL